MYYSYPFNDFEFRNQYDEVLNPDKAIKDKNDNQNYNIKCDETIVYKDKKDLFIKLYGLYAKKFNKYLIHRKKLIYNSVFQNETIQFNNHQLANLDLFLNFCREALSHYKSAFDEAKKEPILIPKEISFIKNSDKKVPSRLLHFKSSYHSRKVNLIASVECQIRNVEDNSFFKKSSCKCIKELIVECNMFIKEVVEYFCLYNLSIRLHECNITLVYNECKEIIQRFTNISRTVKLECIVVIIKMLIKRLESLQEFSIDVDCSLLSIFKSAIHLSLEIDWFISPLKNIVDNIEKEYDRVKSN